MFLVYKNRAGITGSRLADLLMYAVKNACSPRVSILLSETENRRKKI